LHSKTPQQNLHRFALKIALWQILSLLVISCILYIGRGYDYRLAVSLFVGGLASVLPFMLFAVVLISAGFGDSSKIALRFFCGVFLKFILSASMLWFSYFYINLQLFALLAGFMLSYLILLCLPKAKWLKFSSTAASSGVKA
jgi:F0F1-type ATP synthase assembly protein I